MSEQCKNCGSYALNIAPQSGLCDVCYWKIQVEIMEKAMAKLQALTERAHEAIKELQKCNLDEYLNDVAEWGLGNIEEKPDIKDFGF